MKKNNASGRDERTDGWTDEWTDEQRRRRGEAWRVATGWRLRSYKSNDDVTRGRVEYFIE